MNLQAKMNQNIRVALSVGEIFDKITEQKLINTAGKTPEQTLLAAITSDITANGENSTFEMKSPYCGFDYLLLFLCFLLFVLNKEKINKNLLPQRKT